MSNFDTLQTLPKDAQSLQMCQILPNLVTSCRSLGYAKSCQIPQIVLNLAKSLIMVQNLVLPCQIWPNPATSRRTLANAKSRRSPYLAKCGQISPNHVKDSEILSALPKSCRIAPNRVASPLVSPNHTSNLDKSCQIAPNLPQSRRILLGFPKSCRISSKLVKA